MIYIYIYYIYKNIYMYIYNVWYIYIYIQCIYISYIIYIYTIYIYIVSWVAHELPQSHCRDNREGTLFSWLLWNTYDHLYYAPCLACRALFGSLVPAMSNRTSSAQVHELPQNLSSDGCNLPSFLKTKIHISK